MQYPLITEYVRAVQDAGDNLDQLAYLVPVPDNHGEPLRSSGAFAVVFKMRDERSGKCYALKCFTEEQEGRAEAYRQIAEELEVVDSGYVTPVRYLEKVLFVDSSCEESEFPVLLMDWVEGETMERYVAAHYHDSHAMSMLCYRFCRLAAWLRAQPFAHGDLKPDNIMVRPDGSLTLVDYDGMFVPSMKGRKSPTLGTRDFSHPRRTEADFDETIDDFALSSIALSLKAVSLRPSLLDNFGAPDRLLFSAADYRDLSRSKVLAALQPLLAAEGMPTLLSLFLLAAEHKDLSLCSFRLFHVGNLVAGKAKPPRRVAQAAPPKPRKEPVKTFRVSGVSFDMVLVEAGTFTMGATPEMEDPDDDEKPAHQVTLTRDYYMGKMQVTQALWQAVMGTNPSSFTGSKKPVECVSCNDCQEFIAKLNTLTGKEFRLPTEAEWEFAARGGNKSKHYQYSGSNNLDEVAWYDEDWDGTTHDVGTKKPNELGIYDMSGNVWEWCNDWYGDYSSSAQTDPTGSLNGSCRVQRGGSWYYDARYCRSSLRGYDGPGNRYNDRGLRLVLSEL